MTAHSSQARRGVTLTEILISIMILGVGMVSLATLFPIGLLRIRDATRNSRSALLFRNAGSDLQTRNLFDRTLFPFATVGYTYDPWLQDGPGGGSNLDYINNATNGPGLPVAFDPLWFALAGQGLPGTNATRFGLNSNLRLSSGDTGSASSYGLQRISNILPGALDQLAFVSPDDPVLQTEGALTAPLPATYSASIASTQGASPLVPDLSTGSVLNDFAFSYNFTGQQSSANEYTVFHGSVVIHNNRPFALDPTGAAGERVVEGVFGYGVNTGSANGYTTGNPRLVLLRWPATEPDPEVALGSWLADVTYEIDTTTAANKATNNNQILPAPYPMQRCYWYRVAKRSTPVPDPSLGGYRRMQITLTAPVRAKTLLAGGTDTPVYTNAALLCPSVVNVFPKVIYTRD